MALILSIETSTPVCSAALSRNGELIDVRESFDENHTLPHLLFLFRNYLIKMDLNHPILMLLPLAKAPVRIQGYALVFQ
jgi:tRNA A37 threonylcarbamoyladenosine modification protein TsaB